MSYKENHTSSKNKHYSLMERKVFLQILEKFKNVIEIKKSDAATLKDKDIAWSEICKEYNQSMLISQKRTVQQLKKLWANLKQSQRDALTKEKQSRLATGGGSQEAEANIDPDILNIAPHLMENAPVLFTSNKSEAEIEEKREITFDVISTNENVDILHPTNIKYVKNDESDTKIIDSQAKHEFAFNISIDDIEKISDSENKGHPQNNENDNKIIDILTLEKYNKPSILSGTTDIKKKKRKYTTQELLNSSDTEENLRMQRIRQLMDQEQQLASVKLRHEENMAKMKENHLKQLNEMEIQHKSLEIEISKTKHKIFESQYLNKENINLRF